MVCGSDQGKTQGPVKDIDISCTNLQNRYSVPSSPLVPMSSMSSIFQPWRKLKSRITTSPSYQCYPANPRSLQQRYLTSRQTMQVANYSDHMAPTSTPSRNLSNDAITTDSPTFRRRAFAMDAHILSARHQAHRIQHRCSSVKLRECPGTVNAASRCCTSRLHPAATKLQLIRRATALKHLVHDLLSGEQ